MSDYIFCTTSPREPGLVRVHASLDDPRLDNYDSLMLRRSLGIHTLEWTLPVVDRTLTEPALRKALQKKRDRAMADAYHIDPMDARGEAIKLTTLRPDEKKARKKKRGFLRRLLRAA